MPANFKNRLKLASQILFPNSKNVLDASAIITEGLNIGGASVGIWGGLTDKNKSKTSFEQITVKDLYKEDLDELLPRVIKSDPAIDQAYDFFTTLTTQQSEMTAETDRAEREIEEINQILEENNNPFDLLIAHCASSLIMRGDILAETEFDENMEIKNLWIHDPTWVEWRLLTENINGIPSSKWSLGQYREGKWEIIDSPNVFYLAGNPIVGERSSRSPLQTSLFPALAQSGMIQTLQSIMDIHAWAQTLFSVQKLEMIKLDKEGGDVGNINEQILKAYNLISNVLSKKKPNQIMGITDDIKPVELPGGGEKMTFTQDIGNLYDKRTSMGAKTPSTVGGQQQRADYSTRQQNLFYSVYLQSGQENIKTVFEKSYKHLLVSRGVVDDPIYTSKSVNVESRRIEAETFQEIMAGINTAVQSGMSLGLAIAFFEEESGTTFSANLKARIEKESEMMLNNPNNPPNNTPNNTENDEETALRQQLNELELNVTQNRHNNYIIKAGSSYLARKIQKKALENIENEEI